MFDLTVHHIDSKTGRVKEVTPYKLIVEKGKPEIFIRKVNGVEKKFYADGTEVIESKLAETPKIEVQNQNAQKTVQSEQKDFIKEIQKK